MTTHRTRSDLEAIALPMPSKSHASGEATAAALGIPYARLVHDRLEVIRPNKEA
jgi:hypothetical protein